MAALPYMQLYVADYLADTAHLTAAQHGAYLLLIFNYWQRGQPLSNVNERLANVARMSNAEWAENKSALIEFFRIEGDEWHHDRIDSDLYTVAAKSAKAKESGAKSANNRKVSVEPSVNERSTNAERTFNHKDTDTDTDKNLKKKKGADAQFDLPAWLAADVWSDWHQFRNGRKGWTAKARQLSLATLADLYAQGHDPRSVVNKSIECGWTGLFALKQANAPPGHRPSQPSKTFAAIQLLEDMKNGQLGTSSNLGRVPEAPLLELGPDSGDGHDPGYGSRVA